MRVLDDADTGSLISSGCESIAEVRCSSFMNGVIHGIYSWVNTLLMGSLDGEVSWVGCGWVFFGGTGFQTSPFFMLYIHWNTIDTGIDLSVTIENLRVFINKTRDSSRTARVTSRVVVP
jgi:hypothetical protein